MNLPKPKQAKPMSKKKMLLYLGLFMLFLLCLRITWLTFRVDVNPQTEVSQGVIDLQKWEFDDKHTVSLSGEWEFYPYAFIDPGKENGNDANIHTWIKVPGSWHVGNTSMKSPFGYGSYHLKIKIKDTSTVYGLRINNINTSFRLYVNGQLLHEMGHPTETKENNVADNKPYTVSFHSDRDEIDILLHVSNYQTLIIGGINQSIAFGTSSAVMHERFLSETMQLMVCLILLLHLIYLCILYILGYRRTEVVYFVAAFFCAIVGVLIDDDKLLLHWIPMNFEWLSKLRMVAYVGICLFLTLCSKVMFDPGKKIWIRAFTIFSFIYCVALVALPTEIFMWVRYLLLVVVVGGVIFIPMYAVRGTLQGKDGAFFVLLSSVAISMNFVISGIIKTWFWFDMPYYPFDLIISLICFASFWFLRFYKVTFRAQALAEKLQRADRLKDDFLANTSHELRNPLHGMINIAQNVLDESQDKLEDKHRKDLKLMISVGHRMSLLLNDLIDVTLLKEKAIRLDKRGVSLQAAASGVIDMLRYLADSKQIELILNISHTFPKVIADENRLVQILFNLIHNAIKYTHEGQIVLNAEVKNGAAYIHVTDSGVGMDDDTVQRIFQPYEQGDAGITGSISGLGLGLSISKQLVELHGGSLKVETAAYKGSTFTFTLPLEQEGIKALSNDNILELASPGGTFTEDTSFTIPSIHPDAERWKKSDSSLENKPRILAVDDDPVNLKVISNMLSSKFFDLTTVTNAEDALVKLDEREWDLVISDVMMPGTSGYELTKMIRSKFTISELPVLLVTARSQPEDIFTGFIAGANDYVMKPFSSMEFKSRVHALIDLKQSVSERLMMEAAWLHAQIQPHFLFNTLNSIASLSDSDPSRMLRLLEEFGNYLRMCFNTKNLQRLVPLEHELELLRSYLYIEQERFGDRLVVEWEVTDNLSIQLPPLSIQTLVENAIRHGILARSSGGTVKIRIVDEPHFIEIVIQDNGVGMSEEKLSGLLVDPSHPTKGIGLKNTDRRLNQIYGQGLNIVSRPGVGTIVSFKIPKMT